MICGSKGISLMFIIYNQKVTLSSLYRSSIPVIFIVYIAVRMFYGTIIPELFSIWNNKFIFISLEISVTLDIPVFMIALTIS